jgi:hypothetical protein
MSFNGNPYKENEFKLFLTKVQQRSQHIVVIQDTIDRMEK